MSEVGVVVVDDGGHAAGAAWETWREAGAGVRGGEVTSVTCVVGFRTTPARVRAAYNPEQLPGSVAAVETEDITGINGGIGMYNRTYLTRQGHA